MKKEKELQNKNFIFGFNSTAFGSKSINGAGVFVVRNLTEPNKNGRVAKNGSNLGDSSCHFYFFSVESIDKIIKEMKDLRKKMNKNKSVSKNTLDITIPDKKLAKRRKKK